MWSEKQKDHVTVFCAACGAELEAGWDSSEETGIKVDPCSVCLEKADQASFDAGYDEGSQQGYDEGFQAGQEEASADD